LKVREVGQQWTARLFHTRSPATVKARLLEVKRNIAGMTRLAMEAEISQRRIATLATGRMVEML